MKSLNDSTIHNPEKIMSLSDWLALASLIVMYFVKVLNDGMIGVALPSIRNYFEISVELLSLVVAISVVLRVSFAPLFGWLGDSLGRKRVYMGGFLIFFLGLLLGIFAPTFEYLLIARLIQGLGAACIPIAMAIIGDIFPNKMHGRALGLLSAAAPAGILLGPLIGGTTIELFGWRSIFVVGSVLCALALSMVIYFVPVDSGHKRRKNIDWIGTLPFIGLVSGSLLATTTWTVIPLGSPANLLFWVIFSMSLVILIHNYSNKRMPFMGSSAMISRRFATPAIAANLLKIALEGGRFILLLYLANVFGLSPWFLGIAMLTFSVPLAIGVPVGGFFADRLSTRWMGLVGLSMQAIGLLWVGLIAPEAGITIILIGIVIFSLGAGLALVPFSKVAIIALGKRTMGFSSGLYDSIKFFGSAFATPMLALILAGFMEDLDGIMPSSEPYQFCFVILSGVAVLGIIPAVRIPEPAE